MDSQNKTLLTDTRARNGVYKLNLKHNNNLKKSCFSGVPQVAVTNTAQVNDEIWHSRLQHLNMPCIKQLKKHAETKIQFQLDNKFSCKDCVQGKLAEKPFHPSSRAERIPDFVHTDLYQMRETSISQARYSITFLHNYSKKLFVYFLKTKDAVRKVILHFIASAEKQTYCELKCICSDNNREYINEKIYKLLNDAEIEYKMLKSWNKKNFRQKRLLQKLTC